MDPYFNPKKSRYSRAFYTYFSTVNAYVQPRAIVEIHTRKRDDAPFSESDLKNYLGRALQCFRHKLTVFRWKENGNEEMHARYVLTPKVGISIDRGLDESDSSATTDVNLLKEKQRADRWRQYDRLKQEEGVGSSLPGFTLADEIPLRS